MHGFIRKQPQLRQCVPNDDRIVEERAVSTKNPSCWQGSYINDIQHGRFASKRSICEVADASAVFTVRASSATSLSAAVLFVTSSTSRMTAEQHAKTVCLISDGFCHEKCSASAWRMRSSFV